jgi:hypothetical protein
MSQTLHYVSLRVIYFLHDDGEKIETHKKKILELKRNMHK